MGRREDTKEGATPSCCMPVRPVSDGLSETPQAGVKAGASSAEGMIRLPGGTFLMGTDDGQGFREDGEGPVREVMLDPFHISPYATTNWRESTAELFKLWWCRPLDAAPAPLVACFGTLLDRFYPPPA